LLSFSAIPQPVKLKGCAELVPTIGAVLRGWRMENVAEQPGVEPAIIIEATDAGYCRTSRWLSSPAVFRDPVDATCDFLVDLMKAYLAANADLLCLHCAAAQYGDGLVIFPSTYKAGKSLLVASLAQSGVRLFSDDVLPIVASSGHGSAPGFQPRVRLPVPDDAAPGLTDFVERCAGARSARYCYLDLAADALAPLGETAPILGAVLLDRDADATPGITPAGTDEILQSAILRNFAHNLSGLETLDRLHGIIGGARCYRLAYAAASQAGEMLSETFGVGQAAADG
jgi:hypothetical protein